jgi:hypothetical protein
MHMEIEAPIGAIKFGVGVDLVSEQLRKRAIGSSVVDPDAKTKTPEPISFTGKCYTQRDLEKEMGISAGASVSFGLGIVKGHGRVNFAHRHVMSSTTFSLVVKAIIPDSYEWIKDPELTDKAKADYQASHEEFLRKYGDYYIDGIQNGTAFYGLILVECQDEESKREIGVELEAQVGKGLLEVEADGNVKKSSIKVKKGYDVKTFIHSPGYTPEEVANDDPNKLIKQASKFLQEMRNKKHKDVLNVSLRDYESEDMPPNGGRSFDEINESREMFIEKCADLKCLILSELQTINDVKGRPDRYLNQDVKEMTDRELQLKLQFIKLRKRVLKCLKNPLCDTSTKDLEFPQGKDYAIPVEISPISLKYNKINGKEILGTAISPVLKGKRGGEYQLYEKGGIFWHEETLAREVHGAIFKKYESMGLAHGHGKVGYPISDEEDLTENLKYRVNYFEGGDYIYWAKGWKNAEFMPSENRPHYAAFTTIEMRREKSKNTFEIAKDRYAVIKTVKLFSPKRLPRKRK